MIDNFMKDPPANGLAVIVLIALLVSFIGSLVLMIKNQQVNKGRSWYTGLLIVFPLLGFPAALDLLRSGGLASALAAVVLIALTLNLVMHLLLLSKKSSYTIVENWHKWAIPVLVIGGLAVAGYLVFAKLTDTNPSCGPVGDCGAVQNSRYAVVFGILPVGLLGFIGYAAILVAWLIGQFLPDRAKKWSTLIVWSLCIFGVIFSAYLTFLEPFVIGATCMWCIASAVLMTTILWVSTPQAQQALAIDYDDDNDD